MPWGDGTGPMGLGPRTGRGLGFCSGTGVPGFAWGRGIGRAWGRGLGLHWGRGMGWQWFWRTASAPLSEEERKEILRAQLSALDAQREWLKKQLEEDQG